MNTQSISNLDSVLNYWFSHREYSENIQYTSRQEYCSGDFASLPDDLSIKLRTRLQNLGIHQLYSHQLLSYHTVKERKNLVVTTGTASGKTLCYNLPILDQLFKVPSSRALFIFPTKALTHDQQEKLVELTGDIETNGEPLIPVCVYDGDTPTQKRQVIRQMARCLLTNPDMLHTAILPHHTLWETFFRGLDFVVIDEIHAYRGVFGSHVANVIRRLKRIAAFYGSKPQFILTSATIANPLEHGKSLTGEDLVLIQEDGAPHGARTTILYNPPVIHQETGIRKSASSEVIQLAGTLLNKQIQVLIFGRSRKGVEFILRQLRLQQQDDDENYRAYRSGYLPADRRRIESDLRSGKLRAVAATNALELGIDIGGVDAVLITGYPGSVSAMRQQAGRAGRKTEDSVAVLVASGSPIDQYLMRHPDYLVGKSPESALIDPDHPVILLGHLQCAAFELPFSDNECFGTANNTMVREYLEFMNESGQVNHSGGKYFWMDSAYPASNLSLRSSDSRSINLVVEENHRNKIIGEIDYLSSLWMVHPKAIYLHEGMSYFVKNLDLENYVASLEPVDDDYYTEPVQKITLKKINEQDAEYYPGAKITYGEIQVTTEITGFKKLLWNTHEVLSVEPLSLPPNTMRTTAYWMALSDETVNILREQLLWKNDPNDYGKDWDQIRLAVRTRDNFKCQVCGVPESGKAHHVHHKTPLRSFVSLTEANRMENLITLCSNCHQLAESAVKIRSGLAGLGYSMGQLAPLFLMCDSSDLGTLSDPASNLADGKPAVIFYDQINAGIGLSRKCFDLHKQIIASSHELVSNCQCIDGCPSCVGPGGENGAGGKQETLAILELLDGAE
ncbi:DEAD/DEAH box helicase [Leptolinea tardivitalis]|uniref:DEAD/DEAH box helicase n=1 Tax=Leptolinea tardivitalis TaxID=229920 RepID=UPI000784C656|nr:DEAD/DEAH box helicase [Leptolinea tardivitalis]GAP22975.1 distinct helicase family with a unique C-terminal domain including a metal-binding cysteine cluster [Leptolinea tardivitalis]